MEHLILVNPHGGGGKALDTFERHIEPFLREKNLKYKLIKTEREGHAAEIVKEMDTSLYCSVICVSGDGMLHEAVNGLMDRPDADDACRKITFGIFPAGTGNGVSASLGFKKTDYNHICESIFRGLYKPFDLQKVTFLDSGDVRYSVLSVSIGFIADHDVLTERTLRWMGPFAATSIAPVYVWAKQNVYPAKVSFIPKSQTDAAVPTMGEVTRGEEWISVEGQYFVVMACNTSHLASDVVMAPNAKFDDGFMSLVLMHSIGYLESLSILLGLSSGTHVNNTSVEMLRALKVKIEPHKRDGYVSVDGELKPIQPVLIEVAPSQIRFFSSDSNGEPTQ